MNQTIELLLKRMESNPEEFIGSNRWTYIVENFENYLDEEDKAAYFAGISKLRLKKFHDQVLEELLDPKSEESLWGDSPLSRLRTGTQQAGQTHAQSVALQQAYLAQQAQATQAHIQLHQQAIKAQQYNPYLQNTGSGLSGLLGGNK